MVQEVGRVDQKSPRFRLPPADPAAPAAEFRGMFVTTAYNIDWPSAPGLHPNVQKNEMRALIQRAQELNCNAIVLQVRAFGDRIYRDSNLVVDGKKIPWAMSLKFTNDPGPGYDPLEEWIKACHDEGLLLYAWLNPFRTDFPVGELGLISYAADPNHPYLNPADPAAQDHVLDVINDLLDNYPPPTGPTADAGPGWGGAISRSKVCDGPSGDIVATRPTRATDAYVSSIPTTQPSNDDGIDGIIIDHYFPQPPPDPPERKTAASAAMRQGAAAAADRSPRQRAVRKPPPRIQWLLERYTPRISATGSVDDFIKKAYDAVKSHDGKFGISTSMSQFAQPHSNAKKWLQQGWCDYFMPELYVQDLTTFQDALDTWNQLNTALPVTTKPQIVPVLFTSAVETSDSTGQQWVAGDIEAQIQAAKNLQNPGHAHFSARALRSPAAGGPPGPNHDVGDKLKANHYKDPAVPPPVDAPLGQLPEPTIDVFVDAAYLSVSGHEVRGYLVWLDRGAGWEKPKKISAKKGIKYKAAGPNPAVRHVHAVAFDRHGRQSPGKTFVIP